MVVYIFTAFTWWTILHLRNNETFFKNNVEIIKLRNPELTLGEIESSEAFVALTEKYAAKNRMIYGEAFVFITFMLFGTIWIYNRNKKEEAFNQQQQNFLHSVSHELKSPLSGIKLSLETLLVRELDKEKKTRILTNSMSEVNRLNILINNILLSARLGDTSLEVNQQCVDLSSLITSIIKRLEQQYPKRQIKFSPSDAIVHSDQWILESILINLIENALKYSPDDKPVEVEIEQGKNLFIHVIDHGYGLSDKDKKAVFRKFYRVGSEMTRTTKGTGLGLYIVSELVKTIKADLKVSNNKPQGSVFSLKL